MLPWQVPLEAVHGLKKVDAPVHTSLHKYYCNLKIHEKPIEELQTGLMCDISMQNRDTSTIQRLIACGMTIGRLTLRGLDPAECNQLLRSVRQAVLNYSAELKYVYPLALMAYVHGPAIVTGDLKNGPQATVEIIENEYIRLTNEICWIDNGTADCLYVGYENLSDMLPGDIVFIDSLTTGEKVKLTVCKVGVDSLECNVNKGGIVGSKMAVTFCKVPEAHNNTEANGMNSSGACSYDSQKRFERMDDQIEWAISSDLDAVGVPCVQSAIDVRLVKDLLSENGRHILVFASIETVRGLDCIDDILKEADGIYFDRNILSSDLPIEKIFIAQKKIISKCNDVGKPCICKAVVSEEVPTLCVNDVASLIIDGADVIALEFDYNSPLKKLKSSYNPIRMAERCVAAASIICREAEHILWKPRIYGNLELLKGPISEPSKAICVSAVELAIRSRSSIIICLTNSGRTARILSYTKPPCPIVAVTRTCHAGRKLRFWRGVRPVHYFDTPQSNWNCEVEARIMAAIDYCKAKNILKAGDAYVIVTGSRRGVGYCDTVRLLYATSRNTVSID